MDYVNLPSPGQVNRAFDLRKDAARAISHVQIAANHGDGGVASAATLRDFFLACAAACNTAAGQTSVIARIPASVVVQDSTGATATGTATKNSPGVPTVTNGVLASIKLHA